MRFLSECEWEGGAGDGATIATWENIDATETSDAVEASDTAETNELVIDVSELAIDLSDDATDSSEEGAERTDADAGDEWQIDDGRGARARLFQRPHAGGGGTR